DHFAASLGNRWPASSLLRGAHSSGAAGSDRIEERLIAASDLIRGNHLLRRKDRAYLGIERVEGRRGKRLRPVCNRWPARSALLRLEQDEDRQVPGVLL